MSISASTRESAPWRRGVPNLVVIVKLQIPPRASLAACRSLCLGDIFERDNADHSLFTSQHGQLVKISFTHQLFSFSDGLVLKAMDRFLIQFRLREFGLRIVAETADFAVKLPLRHRSE